MDARPNGTAPNTVLLIHGLWMTGRSWERWMERYQSRGYTALAPSWPGMEAEVEALNRDPSPIAALDIEQIIEHYTGIIRGLDRPPIIYGHSLGGTVMQVLIDRGLGAAGVGIAAGTVKGVRDLPLSTIRATLPALRNPFRRKAAPLSRKQFRYAFANTLIQEESDAIYARYHVPGAPKVLRQAAFANLVRNSPVTIDFANPDRSPKLFIAFEHDHIIPPGASRHNAEKYATSPVTTEFREILGRPHFPGAPGWEDVADYALNWVEAHVGSGVESGKVESPLRSISAA